MPKDSRESASLLLTPQQAADELAVARSYIYRLCASGELKSITLRGSQRARRILRSSLIEWIESQPDEPNVA